MPKRLAAREVPGLPASRGQILFPTPLYLKRRKASFLARSLVGMTLVVGGPE